LIFASENARRWSRSSSRPAGLLLKADAAVDGDDPQVAGPGDALHLVDDLRRELAGRGQDQRGRLGDGGIEPLHDRDRERERLAGSRGGFGEHVATGEHVWEHERLDRERLCDATAAEGGRDGVGYAEFGERLGHWKVS
jgi:hypothetical protein